MSEPAHSDPVIGLALGSGSARGWAHIGVIQGLEAIGVRPQVVAGTSIGALVGAVYVSGQLDAFAEWVQKLTSREVFRYMDFSFTGGVVKGEALFGFFEAQHRNPDISKLKQRFASVATEMNSGREIWITKGPILPAARASCALPGLFSPVQFDGQWMLDGGLVNPVPVSTCRALGADLVIAVNLNAQLVGRHFSRAVEPGEPSPDDQERDRGWWDRVRDYVSSGEEADKSGSPRFFDVIASSVNIMQDRITRSRMAGDPPELTLVPELRDFALMDFHRAKEAIVEGRRLVEQHEDMLRLWRPTAPKKSKSTKTKKSSKANKAKKAE